MPNISLLNIPAQAMDFDEAFNLVYSNSAFRWIKEQEDVTALLYRALKKGGRIAVQLPAKDFCWALIENIYSAISTLGIESKYKKMESPWRFPLKEEMSGFLKDVGFVKVNAFYKDYTLMFGSINEVLEWGESAALRPYLALLSEKKQERFKYAFAIGFENYRREKGIEFDFRRLFVLAENKMIRRTLITPHQCHSSLSGIFLSEGCWTSQHDMIDDAASGFTIKIINNREN